VPDALAFYATHDEITDPGRYAPLLDDLPNGLPGLHAAINGLLLHVWKAHAWYGHLLTPPPPKVPIRHTARLLNEVLRLQDVPLSRARTVERRVVVDCRHFAVLLCAVLRHRGVPSRARCGFASYIGGTAPLTDHWACEYWDAGQERWVMEDPDLQRHDVPADAFVTGARAWRLAQEDTGFTDRCEYSERLRGWAALRLNLVRDVAALNGFASVSGDGWGLGLASEETLSSADRRTLDQAAELCGVNGELAALRSLYATPGLAAPDMILHFEGWPREERHVRWRDQP
jgi:Transglutaminase-like superfamily